MAADLDKVDLVERELDNRICLNIVTLFAVLFTASFVVVTTISFLNIQNLDAKDAALRTEIENLQRKLREKDDFRGQVAEGTEELIEKVVKASFCGVVDEVDENEIVDFGEEGRSRRQQIDIFQAILGAQRAVFEKFCVSHNTACPQGPRGVSGVMGEQGLNGSDGSPGTNGTKGISGDSGIPGSSGDLGSKGDLGDPGVNGKPGLIGDTGAWGVNGRYGDRGSRGLKGLKGRQGLKGSVGETGPIGGNGIRGINGTKGDVGETGLKGLNGTKGDIGPKGKDVKSLSNGCECYKKPTFKNPNDQTFVIRNSDQMVIHCDGEGNPSPNITLTKLPQKAGRKRAIVQAAGHHGFNSIQGVTSRRHGIIVIKHEEAASMHNECTSKHKSSKYAECLIHEFNRLYRFK